MKAESIQKAPLELNEMIEQYMHSIMNNRHFAKCMRRIPIGMITHVHIKRGELTEPKIPISDHYFIISDPFNPMRWGHGPCGRRKKKASDLIWTDMLGGVHICTAPLEECTNCSINPKNKIRRSIEMADRSNESLNEEIEYQIFMWDGTIHGQTIKNMYENGSDYESICEVMQIDYADYEEEQKV